MKSSHIQNPGFRRLKLLHAFLILLCFTLVSFDDPVSLGGTRFVDWQYSELHDQAKYQNKPIFIFITTPQCGESKRMSDYFRFSSVSTFYNRNFLSARFIADQATKTIRARQWGVTSVPAYVYMDWTGKVFMKVTGFRNKNQLLEDGQKAMEMFVELRRAQMEKLIAESKLQPPPQPKVDKPKPVIERPKRKPRPSQVKKNEDW